MSDKIEMAPEKSHYYLRKLNAFIRNQESFTNKDHEDILKTLKFLLNEPEDKVPFKSKMEFLSVFSAEVYSLNYDYSTD
jgi:hypothetical protein